MSELFLVRHGQASFGADDYDNLSDLGHEQAAILAEYWNSLGQRFDAIYSGSLKRQRATAEGLRKQVDQAEVGVHEGLNEYVSHHILDAYREQYARADGFVIEGEGYASGMKDRRFFQRFLEQACQRWVQGELESDFIEPFPQFKQRVGDALQEIMAANSKGRRVVLATSGGVIAIAVQSVLNVPDEQAINLNWMVYNTSITRIPFSGARKSLSVFNSIPHLDRPGYTDKISYR
ncbi:histidine phosphatase family protein [Gilvimarinus sp. F26214L]|uniref:histidine phosphatase family protein n=1 Tax=Gilvimarinus sp. DZF01 TaxID=3461371 RepID=UPI0040455D90